MLVVRNTIETDIEGIASLENQIFSDAWTSKSIYDTFCQRQAFIVSAEKEGKLVGYCIVYFALDEAEIARIAVDTACRRQGVGRELLDQVQQICHEKGITHLLLDMRESNDTARAFYRDYGFGIDGVRKDFYGSPKENAVLMSMVIH